MFKPSAKIIADSINESGDRLTTFVLTYHRMIHSEFMTHRMLSKNSSSSRAIPVEKMIAKLIADDVYPLYWGKNQKGMVATKEVDEVTEQKAMKIWDYAREDAIGHASYLAFIGIHKQVVNRLLEPFSTITVICSGTEYQNFFDQRCHPDAQPEIRALADAMRVEYDASEPNLLKEGQWHIPFISQDMGERPANFQDLIKVAVGCCARVSYLNHDGVRNIADDIKLHDRLLTSRPAHLSPFEHCAVAAKGKFANFTGWQSYRWQVENA
jgi:thymidylate synthase ThyX